MWFCYERGTVGGWTPAIYHMFNPNELNSKSDGEHVNRCNVRKIDFDTAGMATCEIMNTCVAKFPPPEKVQEQWISE